jgi:CubicO group peptidase (beta-lactamase class C family)
MGSISKQFLAAGVMRLVERGALALDDPVSRHVGTACREAAKRRGSR